MTARETGSMGSALIVLALALSCAAPSSAAARWKPVGPPGGTVRALAADPDDRRHVFLGTANGILYRSDDAGATWRRMSPGFAQRGVSLDEIAVLPGGRVLVGFWEVDGRGGGVALSDDHGRSFVLGKGIEGQSVRALAVSPSNPELVAVGTLEGVFLSRDRGGTWTRYSPPGHATLHHIESLAFDPLDSRALYVGTWHLSWMTPDGGTTWVPLHRGMKEDSDVMTLTFDPRNSRILYATACTGIYRSNQDDAGWTAMKGIPEASQRTRAFAVDAGEGLMLAGTTQGLWVSEDRGATWRCATQKQLVVNDVLVGPRGTVLIGTDDAGVLRSDDRGRTWTASNEGFSERFVSAMRFDEQGDRVLVAVRGDARFGGVFSAPGVRGPWTALSDGMEGRQVLSLATLGDRIFAGTDSGVFVRDPSAARWVTLPMGTPRGAPAAVTEILAEPSGGLIVATSAGVLRSGDAGRTWSRPAPEMGTVLGLAASPRNGDLLIAATARGIFRSSDHGATWTLASPALSGATPHDLAFLPGDDRVLFATTSSGLYRSPDQGSSWKRVGGGIPHSDLMGLAIASDGRTLCVSDFAWGGLFRSTDAGATWSRMPADGLGSERVWTVGIVPGARSLLVGASAGGLHLMVAP
jgi:photosystem II stability/assembly factor-like uncharacterized protein